MFAFRSALAVVAAGFLASLAAAADLKFEIYKDAKDEFRWRLKDGDTVLGTGGQGYAKKADAQKGVERMQKDAGTDALAFEVYEDNAKKFRWRAKVKNGNVVAASASGYETKAEAEKAVKGIEKDAAKAKVVDETK
ncbi:MAG: DUF1508 domain-containing protein [Gemmataceae bacterium]